MRWSPIIIGLQTAIASFLLAVLVVVRLDAFDHEQSRRAAIDQNLDFTAHDRVRRVAPTLPLSGSGPSTRNVLSPTGSAST